LTNLNQLMADVRFSESSDNYEAVNGSFHGAYQFGLSALVDTGYVSAGSTDLADTSWTGKNGINGLDDWYDNSDVQDSAFIEWVQVLWQYVRRSDWEPYAEQTLNGHELSISGMILASHLVGTGAFRNEFLASGGIDDPVDGNNVAATTYLGRFTNYDVTDTTGVNPDLIPVGFTDFFVTNIDQDNTLRSGTPENPANGDDILSGFAGNDTVYGSDGDDLLDGGEDTDTLTYAEIENQKVVVSVKTPSDEATPIEFYATSYASVESDGTANWQDTFLNFEQLTGTNSEFDRLDFRDFQGDITNPDGEEGQITVDGQTLNIEAFEIVYGSETNSEIRSGAGHQDIFGGPEGSESDDILAGGAGADRLYGGGGNDTLNGGTGADILFYTVGSDTLMGGLGNDYYDFTEATGRDAVVVLEEGFGRDVFSSNYSAVDRVVFEGLSSSDVTFTWDYTVQTFNQGFFTSQFYDGAATITVNATGDSLYLGNVGGQVDSDRFGLLNSFIQSFFTFEFTDGVFGNWNSLFGRPDQISSQAIDPAANTALQDHEDERAQDPDPDTETETREFDDGRILVSQLVDGVKVSATMTDVADAYVWTSYVDSFDAAEERVSRSLSYDDGRTAETTYTDGVRSTNIITDAADAFAWASLDQTFDASGVRAAQTNTYDDGRILETMYVDGIRSAATITDVEDAYNWASYVDTYDDAGDRISRSQEYDDGRTAETTYTNGVRSMNIITDTADEFVWATIDQTFDASGVRTAQTNSYDDGRILETLYADGVRSTATMTDVEDAYNWASYVDIFDDLGDRISRTFTNDDGSEFFV